MTRPILVRLVATVVIGVFAIGIWVSGDDLRLEWLRFFSTAVLGATAVLWLWDTILWRTPLAQRLPRVPRNLNGTWKGSLDSIGTDALSGSASSAPKEAYLAIRQTASTVSAILMTDESRSVSSVGLVSGGGGLASLDYMYLNRPDVKVEHRSRMHHGSASLDITGLPATRLRGRYWTDRDTRGQLDFNERRKEVAEDYEHARSLFGS